MSTNNENTTTQQWATDVLERIDEKMRVVNQRNENQIPYIVRDGHYNNMVTENVSWWTNGFFAGSLWQLYHATNEAAYKDNARKIEVLLDQTFENYYGLQHDVGFMFLHSAVADYRLTGDETARKRGLHAANILAGRFNVNGNFIRSWNQPERAGWTIVDSLMNISLLFWATSETNDPRYQEIGMRHADRLLECLVRPDDSVGHVATFDPETGEFLGLLGGQGYDDKSAWARGQAWALYGYALSYHHTKEQRYLDAAKRIANFYIANVSQEDYLSLVDFRAPYETKKYDSSAGLCAACGMLEIADQVGEYEAGLYREAAEKIIKATVDNWCDWDLDQDGIVGMVSHSYHQEAETHVKIVYGDYFLIEGILRLLNKSFLIW